MFPIFKSAAAVQLSFPDNVFNLSLNCSFVSELKDILVFVCSVVSLFDGPGIEVSMESIVSSTISTIVVAIEELPPKGRLLEFSCSFDVIRIGALRGSINCYCSRSKEVA